jgi:hypothetical protein
MAGHSHASNVKYKKNRNNKLKGESFLKLRKKLENIYREEGDQNKLIVIARENNFPKEKVNLIVKKIANLQDRIIFSRFLYKSDFNIIWCLEGFFDQKSLSNLNQISLFFKLENLKAENIFEYFECLYLLRLKTNEDFEDLAFSLFSSSIIDKIKRIDRINVYRFNFEVVFLEKQARCEAIERLKLQFSEIEFEFEDFFSPFYPFFLNLEEKNLYFLLLKEKFLQIGKNVKIFTNVIEKKKDHSSVG